MFRIPAPFSPAPRLPRWQWVLLLLAAALADGTGTAAAEEGSPAWKRIELRPDRKIRHVGVGECGLAGEAVLESQGGLRFRIRFEKGRPRLEPISLCREAPSPPDPERLPDGKVSRGVGDIASAWLAAPTSRYPHGVLGDAIEAGELRLATRDGLRLRYRLEADTVFEDRLARIVDLDGDGKSELLVVRSGLESGAALALFAVENGALRLVAQSENLGQPNRWLNPIGAGDFDGDGGQEIAAVLTPHIGGTLTLFQRKGGRLIPKLAQPGFSNHAIGSRELGMAALLDLNGDGILDLAVPDDSRERLRLVTFAGGQFRQLGTITHSASIVTGIAVADLDGNGLGDLVYALENGLVVLLVR